MSKVRCVVRQKNMIFKVNIFRLDEVQVSEFKFDYYCFSLDLPFDNFVHIIAYFNQSIRVFYTLFEKPFNVENNNIMFD